jgi:hypothetical protein
MLNHGGTSHSSVTSTRFQHGPGSTTRIRRCTASRDRDAVGVGVAVSVAVRVGGGVTVRVKDAVSVPVPDAVSGTVRVPLADGLGADADRVSELNEAVGAADGVGDVVAAERVVVADAESDGSSDSDGVAACETVGVGDGVIGRDAVVVCVAEADISTDGVWLRVRVGLADALTDAVTVRDALLDGFVAVALARSDALSVTAAVRDADGVAPDADRDGVGALRDALGVGSDRDAVSAALTDADGDVLTVSVTPHASPR